MYILQCTDDSYYTGSTVIDPPARTWQHNHDDERGADYTRRRRPVRLVYVEEFPRIEDAFLREKQVQGWSRAKKKALIDYRGEDLPALARGRSGPSTGSGTGTKGSG